MPFATVTLRVQAQAAVRDDGGGTQYVWQTMATCRGEKHFPKRGPEVWAERGAAGRQQAEAVFTFRPPYPAITTVNRIVEPDGTAWTVHTVRQYDWTMQVYGHEV